MGLSALLFFEAASQFRVETLEPTIYGYLHPVLCSNVTSSDIVSLPIVVPWDTGARRLTFPGCKQLAGLRPQPLFLGFFEQIFSVKKLSEEKKPPLEKPD